MTTITDEMRNIVNRLNSERKAFEAREKNTQKATMISSRPKRLQFRPILLRIFIHYYLSAKCGL